MIEVETKQRKLTFKLTNNADSTADGDDWAGVDLTNVLARVALLRISC